MSDDINDVPIEFATGRRRDDREFVTRKSTVGDFVGAYFSDFQRGPKDGPCILQGSLVGTQRASRNVRANYLVMLDHDSGETMDEISAKISEACLTAILWNTHSHMTTESEIGQDALDRFMKLNDITDLTVGAAQYLHEKKGVVEAILQSITSVDTEHRQGGVKYIVTHAPMPKCRSLFILDTPFEFAVPGVAHKDRIEEWKARYKGFAQHLGVVVDEKTCDPARLMYTPRIAAGADRSRYEIRFVDGRALTVEDMPEYVDPSKAAAQARREVSALLADVSGGDVAARERATYQTPGLAKFLAVGKTFQASQWMNNVGEFRGDRGEGRGEFMCPFDDMHSNPGDPNDKAFFAVDWSEENPWHMGCQHATCSGHTGGDRAQYLDQACVLYGVKDAADLLTWCADEETARAGWAHVQTTVKVEAAAQVTDLSAAIAAVTSETGVAEIDRLTMAIALAGHKTVAGGDHITNLAARCGRTKGVIKAAVETAARSVAKRERNAAAPNEVARNTQNEHPPLLEDADHSNVREIWAHWSYPVRKRMAVRGLEARNTADPKIFWRPEGGLFRLVERNDQIKLDEIDTKAKWIYELTERFEFKTISQQDSAAGEDGELGEPMTDIVTHFEGNPNLKVPTIERIVGVPVFGKTGSLRTERGFDHDGNTYLYPSLGFEAFPCPMVPTADDVDEALYWLGEATRDFPFSDDFSGNDPLPIRDGEDEDGHPLPNLERGKSSRAHFIAMFLQPFVRSMIKGPCPAFLIDKTMPGTGAGFLADVLAAALYGTKMAPEVVSEDSEEFRKAVTTSLRAGAATIFLDNINHKVDSAALAAALTSGQWRARLLGTNDQIDVPVTATWIFAANGGEFTEELMRRIVPIRLDAACEDPARDRAPNFYKHNPLHDWLEENRAQLVWAAHVLIQNWIAHGQQPHTERCLQSFNHWSRAMGGILDAAGIEGFLENLPSYLSNRGEDTDHAVILLQKIWEVFQARPFTLDELRPQLTLGISGDIDPVYGLNINTDKVGGQTSALGRSIQKFTGRVITVDGRRAQLKKGPRVQNRATYQVVNLSE